MIGDEKPRDYEKIESEILNKLDYDNETGLFWWKAVEDTGVGSRIFNTNYAGKVAGTLSNARKGTGYVRIYIDGVAIQAHRIAWWLHYGVWPDREIDHIDQIRSNNRIENLRLVDKVSQNRNASRRRDNTSGQAGVAWSKEHGKWRVRINIDRKEKHLGFFDDFEEAVAIRKEAEREHGYSPRHGVSVSKYGSLERAAGSTVFVEENT